MIQREEKGNDLPLLHQMGWDVFHHASIIVVPADGGELASCGVVAEHRIARRGAGAVDG